MDALLQAGAVAHQVQPPAGTLALGAYARVGQPDRRHQVTADELGQHPGVDPVGLAGKRRQPLHLLGIGDLDLPAGKLELVVHEAGAVHRLDRGADRLAVSSDAFAQVLQSISVRWRSATLDCRTPAIEQVEVETLAAEIQTGVQHCNGPPFVSRGRAEHDSAGGPSSWHSLPARCSRSGAKPIAMASACFRRYRVLSLRGWIGSDRSGAKHVRVLHLGTPGRRFLGGCQDGAEPGNGRAEGVFWWGAVADHERWTVLLGSEPIGVETVEQEPAAACTGDDLRLGLTFG